MNFKSKRGPTRIVKTSRGSGVQSKAGDHSRRHRCVPLESKVLWSRGSGGGSGNQGKSTKMRGDEKGGGSRTLPLVL